MSETAFPCPKCQTSMEKGLIPENTYLGVFKSAWSKGESTVGAERLPIQAYRCPRCFFIEFYALPK